MIFLSFLPASQLGQTQLTILQVSGNTLKLCYFCFQKRNSTVLTPQLGFLNLFLQLFLPIFGHDLKRKLTNQSEGACDVIQAKTDLGKVGLLLS